MPSTKRLTAQPIPPNTGEGSCNFCDRYSQRRAKLRSAKDVRAVMAVSGSHVGGMSVRFCRACLDDLIEASLAMVGKLPLPARVSIDLEIAGEQITIQTGLFTDETPVTAARRLANYHRAELRGFKPCP